MNSKRKRLFLYQKVLYCTSIEQLEMIKDLITNCRSHLLFGLELGLGFVLVLTLCIFVLLRCDLYFCQPLVALQSSQKCMMVLGGHIVFITSFCYIKTIHFNSIIFIAHSPKVCFSRTISLKLHSLH